MRGEQHDVRGTGRGIAVLLVLNWIAGPLRGADDQRGGAVELRGRRLADLPWICSCRRLRDREPRGGLLQPQQRVLAEHAKAPWIGEIVIRRPARELELHAPS